MDINLKVRDGIAVRAFYLFFIVATLQSGVGVMEAPRDIFIHAGQDSWLSIVIAYGFMALIVYIMFLILNQYESADIFGIQTDVFGKWIGKLLGTVYIVHFLGVLISVLLTYIEVVQVFIYPELSSFWIGLLLLSLSVYATLGGIRVIVGVTFLFFILTQWLFLLLYHPIANMDIDHFLPILQTPLPDILKGGHATIFTFGGFEILFLIYPFINNKEKSKLPIFLGISFTTFALLLTTMITIGYFGLQNIPIIDWPTLTLYKSVAFSFVERMDYIVIIEWMMVIIPNNILLLWGVTHGMKRLYNVPQRITVYVVAILTLMIVSVIKSHHIIDTVTDVISQVGFWLIYVYPFILLPIVLLKKKLNQTKGRAKK